MSPSPTPASPPPAPGFAEALRFWFKLGCISFGGPAGQIALMHEELVERRRWISERRFLHALNYCMVLPGPEAQQLATYLGWLLHRTRGGIAAGVLFVLPSLLLLIALSAIYMTWGQTPLVAGLLYGVKPAVTAIVLHAAWRIGTRTLKHPLLWALAAAAFVAMWGYNAPFPAIVAVAALLGWALARVLPAAFAGGGGHGGRAAAVHAPALIDDDTPAPPHARHRPARLALVLAGTLLLWLLPWGAAQAAAGAQGLFTQLGWFFTKAALLTFGGAYAVLPYVTQAAVTHFGWLTTAQMMDGLALGETTPGPLIMIVAFVGFVAAWQSPEMAALFGPDRLWLAGALAATWATWFTFLPSFMFILAGGPLVESTRGQLRLVGPLTAISAAVVGVIVKLALFFGQHVLWPQGVGQAPDLWAAAIMALAALALWRLQRSVLQVIGACALLGLLLQWALH